MALDDSIDAGDAALLLVFIRGVNGKFHAIIELLSMKALGDITSGDDLHENLLEILEVYKLS
jgi:hypothetical protein